MSIPFNNLIKPVSRNQEGIMPTMQNRLIPLTDTRGTFLWSEDENEPLPGSIVLTSGYHGTAWQRHFADGLWYPATRAGRARTWHDLIKMRNAVLVYDAEERS